ncbi:MAG: SEL1-like repeat protein [Synergistaceae bacterium]|nr:SEL1-like repeat protein [Synergistaceae bacterium]
MTQDITNLINDAKNGNPRAQYNLGVCYHSGRDGIEQDYEQAAMWYQKAAEQGHVRASFYLGMLYQNGKGAEQNYKKATELFMSAAESGYDKAQINLGIFYVKGIGVPKDYGKAEFWFQKAADQGNEKAVGWLKFLAESNKADKKFSILDSFLASFRNSFPVWLKYTTLIAGAVSLLTLMLILIWSLWPEGKKEIHDIISEVIPATVLINVRTDNSYVTGSGFFALNGKIFTNAHVVEGAKSISIKTHNGKTYDAEILDANKDLDLAVLTANVNKKDYSNLSFASQIPNHGTEIVVIGSPLGYEQTVSNGLVSAIRSYDDITILQNLLRANKYSSVLSKSPENEKVRVIDSELFEVRTVAKVQSISTRKIYWINSASVMRPVEMNLDEFIAKFNDGAADSEKLREKNIITSNRDNISIMVRGNTRISLKMDEKTHKIKDVLVSITKQEMNSAEGIHPLIQQTINVFYPIPVIYHSDFYKKLLEYNFGSFTAGKFKKFPVEFFMMYNHDSYYLLSVTLNNNSKKEVSTNNQSSESSKVQTSSAPNKKKKTYRGRSIRKRF